MKKYVNHIKNTLILLLTVVFAACGTPSFGVVGQISGGDLSVSGNGGVPGCNNYEVGGKLENSAGDVGESGAAGNLNEAGVGSEISSGNEAGASNSPEIVYDWRTDDRMLGWYEPDSFHSKAVDSPWGDLYVKDVGTGLTIDSGVSLNGKPVWKINKTTGGVLATTAIPIYKQPVHLFIIAKSIGTNQHVNDVLIASSDGGVGQIVYGDSTHFGAFGGGLVQMPAETTSYHLIEFYFHGNYSYYSVDNSVYVRSDIGTGGDWGGFTIGALPSGTYRGDWEIAGFVFYEGQAGKQFRQGFTNYVKSQWGLNLPDAPKDFTVNAPIPTLWNSGAPWDAIIDPFTQSNGSNFATGPSETVAGNIFELANSDTWQPATSFWDSYAQQTDSVSLDPVGTQGSLLGSLANKLQLAWNRPLVAVPCAKSASYLIGTSASKPASSWARTFPRNHHLRNSLYWSSVYRAREIIRLGGTIRLIFIYQGESEAQYSDPAVRAFWPETLHSLIRLWCSDVGIKNPYDHPEDHTTITVIVRIAPRASPGWTDFRDNVITKIPQNANQVLVDAPDGPYEPDRIHLNSIAQNALGKIIATAALRQ